MLNRLHLRSRMIKLFYLIAWLIFSLSPVGFAQDVGIHNTVRIIYFVPQDTTPRPNIHAKLDRLIKDVQQLYDNEMQRHGFGRKTFALETNRQGKAVVHRVNGQFPQAYYQYQTENRVSAEITSRFDFDRNVYLLVLEIGQEKIGGGWCGVGGDNWNDRGDVGGRALVSTYADCLSEGEGAELIAHELGHTFGLFHDFRDNTYLMSYGDHRTKLSKCAGEWLNAHRYFNNRKTPVKNTETTFAMLPVEEVQPNGIRLRFKVTDPDGLRYAQLLTTSTGLGPGQPMLIGCRGLNNRQNDTATFVIKELPSLVSKYPVVFRIVDRLGNYAWQSYEIQTLGLVVGPKIEGPWLWMLTSTGDLGGASAAASGIDYLTVASNGSVREQDIATTGATEGDQVGDRVWTQHRLAPTGNDNITDLINAIGWATGDIDNAVVYGSVILNAPRRQETTMFVGSDDAVKVWLNGKLVHNNPINRGAHDYQDTFSVRLKKGQNVLLVAVYEFWGSWSGFFGLQSGTNYTVKPQTTPKQQANGSVVDVNADGVVNVLDLVIVANALGKNTPDLNDDGIVNVLDLLLVANAF